MEMEMTLSLFLKLPGVRIPTLHNELQRLGRWPVHFHRFEEKNRWLGTNDAAKVSEIHCELPPGVFVVEHE